MKRPLLVALVSVVALGIGCAIGAIVADDSTRVDELDTQVARLTVERDRETTRAAELASQLDSQDEEIVELEEDLEKAEARAAAGAAPSAPNPATSGLKRRQIGESANVGQYKITPTSFTREFVSGDEATYHAIVSVQNNASGVRSPFCADEGGEVVDTRGRLFEPESILDDDSNNCEDIQPGLSLGNFKLAFKMPASAKPMTLRLWGDYDNDVLPGLWAVN